MKEKLSFTKKRIYRNKVNGIISGICAGAADYLDVPVIFVRLMSIFLMFMSGFFPFIAAYIALSIILPTPDSDENLKKNSESTIQDWNLVSQRLKKLEQKVAKMESYLVSEEYDLERKYRSLL